MAIYFRFDHTRLENNIQKLDLAWVAGRTKQTTMHDSPLSHLWFLSRHHVTVTILLPNSEVLGVTGPADVSDALVATSLESGGVGTSFSLDLER